MYFYQFWVFFFLLFTTHASFNFEKEQEFYKIIEEYSSKIHRKLTLNEFQWMNCGDKKYSIDPDQIAVYPFPFQIPGNLTISFRITIKRNIKGPIAVKLKFSKKIFTWIEIPCVDKIGSCNYDDICPMIQPLPCPSTFKCHCPFEQGNYYLPPTNFSIPFHVPSFLKEGSYRLHIDSSDSQGPLLCLYVQFSMK